MGKEQSIQKDFPAQRSVAPHALAFFRITFGDVLLLTSLSLLLNAESLTPMDWSLFLGMLVMAFLLTIGAWLRYTALILAAVYTFEWVLLLRAGLHTNVVTSLS